MRQLIPKFPEYESENTWSEYGTVDPEHSFIEYKSNPNQFLVQSVNWNKAKTSS